MVLSPNYKEALKMFPFEKKNLTIVYITSKKIK